VDGSSVGPPVDAELTDSEAGVLEPGDISSTDDNARENADVEDPEPPPDIEVDTGPPADETTEAAVRATLLDGVRALNSGEALLSRLIVVGDNALVVAADSAGHPVVAAGSWGEGRFVVIGHEGVAGFDASADPGFHRLMVNAGSWLSEHADRVVVWDEGMNAAATTLAGDEGSVLGGGPGELSRADIFVTTAYREYSESERSALLDFVQGGGSLVVVGHAWWWASSGGVDAPRNFPGNRLLSPLGVVISERTTEFEPWPMPEHEGTTLHHAGRALDRLIQTFTGRDTLEGTDLVLASRAAGEAVDQLPMDSDFFVEARQLARLTSDIVPPIRPAEQPIEALSLRVQIRLALDLPADEVPRRHMASGRFPGSGGGNESIDKEVTIATGYDGYDERFAFSGAAEPLWHSTGLWAEAGGPVTVEIPADATGLGLRVQIGAHTDVLFDLPEWNRVPRLVQSWPLDAATVRVASGFGGPVYILEPAGTPARELTVSVAGGHRMAHFILGETTNEEWRSIDWEVASQWVELESSTLILTVPTWPYGMELEDPEALLQFWDRAMEATTRLAGLENPRSRPERFVVDEQISAGWMHSGYPVMAHRESGAEVVSLESLRSVGAWGPFHEFGHNHQNIDWVLPGTEESSVNLWSVYVSEEVAGVSRESAHPELSPSARAARVASWKSGADRDWSVWMALETYLQLQEEFGWEPYLTVFRDYLDLDAADRPSTDEERAQLWVVMMSQATGRDLTDFHRAWGFAVSPQTEAAVAALPAWDDHPMR
jgi:hypothetical protein